jgi:hypothetical protein
MELISQQTIPFWWDDAADFSILEKLSVAAFNRVIRFKNSMINIYKYCSLRMDFWNREYPRWSYKQNVCTLLWLKLSAASGFHLYMLPRIPQWMTNWCYIFSMQFRERDNYCVHHLLLKCSPWGLFDCCSTCRQMRLPYFPSQGNIVPRGCSCSPMPTSKDHAWIVLV